MAKLIVIQDGREKTFDLVDELVFVGSAADCSIRVSGEGVSDKHCQLLKVDETWRLVDLSGGGTRVNGEPAPQRVLANGDVIQVGPLVLNFRGNVAPQAMPGGASASAAAAGAETGKSGGRTKHSSRVAGRARSKASRARKGRDGGGGKEIKVDSQTRRTADQRDTMSRKRVRKEGLTGPQTTAIAVAVVILLLLVLMKTLGGISSDGVGNLYEQASAKFELQKYSEAKKLIAQIPADSSIYSAAQRMLRRIEELQSTRIGLDKHQDGARWYENQIRQFVIDKIDPTTRKKKYADSEVSQIRYVIKRIEHFLAEFKGHKYYPEVEALHAKYKPMVPSTPPTYLDIDVEARHEKNLKRYGAVYRTLSGWLAANPASSDEIKARVRRLLDNVVNDAQVELNYRDKDARKNMEGAAYQSAYQKYMKCAGLFDGIADADMPRINGRTASELAAELQQKINELTPAG